MFYKVIAIVIGTVVSLGALKAAAADTATTNQAMEPATIVIYRAQELPKSERIGLDVHVDESSLGRLTAEDTIVLSGAPGQYTLDTSIANTQSLLIDLKPGSTHYIKTEVALQGTTVKVKLVEVEEQVAKIQNSGLNGAI